MSPSKMKWLSNLIGQVGVVLLLSSCGFHLRGLDGEDSIYWHWITPESVEKGHLHDAFVEVLQRRGVSKQKISPVVRLREVSYQEQIVESANNTLGMPAEYLLQIDVEAGLLCHQKWLGNPIHLTIQQYQTWTNSDALNQSERKRILRQMRYRAAEDLLQKLFDIAHYEGWSCQS